jgi:hypothetical protein
MTDDDHDRQLQLLHAQIDRLTRELLQCKQDIASKERTAKLLQRLSPDLVERIGEDLLDQMLQAAGDRAVEQATGEFPEFLREIEDRAQRRGQRCSASPRRSLPGVDHDASDQNETTSGDPDQAP